MNTEERFDDLTLKLADLMQVTTNHIKADEQFQKQLTDDISSLRESVAELKANLDPIKDAYSAVLFSKQFIIGLAGVILAVGAVGAGFIWLINAAVQK